jgi:glycerol kinase
MERDAGIQFSALRVDGGASRNNLLMQLQADILGLPIVRPTVSETTALGAAYAAGLAAGVWDSLDAVRQHWNVDRVFEPSWSADRRDEGYAGWRHAVERSRGWAVRVNPGRGAPPRPPAAPQGGEA